MTDRPILFSGPMVRALLDGSKTQTRRALKPQPSIPYSGLYRDDKNWWTGDEFGYGIEALKVPYASGDRLWVREAWYGEEGDLNPAYAATDARTEAGWRPSIHMPRWASRLTLIVTDVRVQHLRDISEEDAIAEGIECKEFFDCPCWKIYGDQDGTAAPDDPVASYASLWNHCYGPGAWDANPWVVATTFTVHHRNIDQMGGE